MSELSQWGLFLLIGAGTFAIRLSFIEFYVHRCCAAPCCTYRRACWRRWLCRRWCYRIDTRRLTGAIRKFPRRYLQPWLPGEQKVPC